MNDIEYVLETIGMAGMQDTCHVSFMGEMFAVEGDVRIEDEVMLIHAGNSGVGIPAMILGYQIKFYKAEASDLRIVLPDGSKEPVACAFLQEQGEIDQFILVAGDGEFPMCKTGRF